jgi:hypothetical protein
MVAENTGFDGGSGEYHGKEGFLLNSASLKRIAAGYPTTGEPAAHYALCIFAS